MLIPTELLEKTRVKGYTTLIAICDNDNGPPEIRLQAALALLAATEREQYLNEERTDPMDEPPEGPVPYIDAQDEVPVGEQV